MYLSVQGAADRLGVSPHTIRRWTASGFLPCTRTSGGHRRIKQVDIDELAHLIGGRNHLAARLAAERQLETLAEATVLLAADPVSTRALGELARLIAALLDGHRCVISALRPGSGGLVVVGAWDAADARDPLSAVLEPARRPLIGAAFSEGRVLTVNVGDQRADPAELALLRRNGDKCLILAPVLAGGRATGLVEVLDHLRERRLSRQEARLAEAAAAQVAVALRDEAAGDDLRCRTEDLELLRRAVAQVSAGQADLAAQRDSAGVLHAGAALALRALQGITCVAGRGDESAGATDAAAAAGHGAAGATARVLTASSTAAGGQSPVTLTLTLGRPPAEGEREVLALIAGLAAGALAAPQR